MDKRILIVEDEESIARGLQMNLTAAGFRTEIVSDGYAALNYMDRQTPDIVLLDIMLPGISGFEVCKRVRLKGNRVPILFLTARSSTDDRLKGLKLGGDDYITKPFNVQELILRINAIIRRETWYSEAPRSGKKCKFGLNEVDFEAYKAKTSKGSVIMTQKESMLLKLLADNEGIVINRNMILDHLWGYEYERTNRTIDNLIMKLRRYFELNPKQPKHILTHYGAGYKFVK